MSSLWYIIQRRLINTVKEAIRKPARLVLYLFVIGMICFTFLTPNTNIEHNPTLPSFYLFYACFLLNAVFLFSYIKMGISSGSTIFEMNDVNFLFVSPLHSNKILIYGIISNFKTSFLMSFFILFQGQIMAMFGLPVYFVFVLCAIFILTIMTSGLLSVFIYIQTNGNSQRKKIVIGISILLFLPFLLHLLQQAITTRDVTATLTTVSDSILFQSIPIIGWSTAAFQNLAAGNITMGLVWLALFVVFIVIIIALISKSNANYYEDVLVATETNFQKKQVMAEKNAQGMFAQEVANKKVKINQKNMGIKGSGASTFFFKHLREKQRKRKLGFLTVQLIVFIIMMNAIAFFGKMDQNDSNINMIMFLVITMISVWMQMFLVGSGEGLRELYTPNIYLVPASSLSKLIWANMVDVFYAVLEGICLFIGPMIILEINPMLFFIGVLIYVASTALFISANCLSLRIFNTITSASILIMVYMMFLIIVLVPGIVAGIIVGFILSQTISLMASVMIALLIFVVWELLLTLLFMFLSRGILTNADMPTVQMMEKKQL